MLWNSPSVDQDLCSDFSIDEVTEAIKALKSGKAPGVDNLHPEFFLHLHESCTKWLQTFFNSCLKNMRMPKIWKLAKVVCCTKTKETSQ